jgi:hypothetical protein
VSRDTLTSREVEAGCKVCFGAAPKWKGNQALGTAARHHDSTGHQTWFVVVTTGLYGSGQTDDAQLDIEAAIAAVPA